MKGVIVKCLEELVGDKFGKDKWQDTLEKAGLKRTDTFLTVQDVDDNVVLKIIDSICKVANITFNQAADAFGDYWVNVYAPKIYAPFYSGVNSAKEFLLRMDKVHSYTTENLENARPPKFEYDWNNDKTLIMKYKSHRGLIDLMVSLIKGVGKYYDEDLHVTRLGDDQVRIVFNNSKH
jgi:hypothetical protein